MGELTPAELSRSVSRPHSHRLRRGCKDLLSEAEPQQAAEGLARATVAEPGLLEHVCALLSRLDLSAAEPGEWKGTC